MAVVSGLLRATIRWLWVWAFLEGFQQHLNGPTAYSVALVDANRVIILHHWAKASDGRALGF
ncbi:MAG: hypothetical protein Q9212_002996 [Teloschistes hypoglaucus]